MEAITETRPSSKRGPGMLATNWEAIGVVAAVAFGLFGAVTSIVTLRRQGKAEARSREKWQKELAKDKEARLDFELVALGDGGFRLMVLNAGGHDATDVRIQAVGSSPVELRPMVHFDTIPAGSHRGHEFTNDDWQVIGGSQLGVQASWGDGRP